MCDGCRLPKLHRRTEGLHLVLLVAGGLLQRECLRHREQQRWRQQLRSERPAVLFEQPEMSIGTRVFGESSYLQLRVPPGREQRER